MALSASPPPPVHTIPIDQRPKGYGSLFSKIFFPIIFNLGLIALGSAQFLFLPLLLIPFVGRRLFRRAIDWTKDGFGRLLIAITVLFAPTSIVLTTDAPPEIAGLVERDAGGNVTKLNLPDRLVLMSNHQTHIDWIYLWILACYSGHAEGITIILKASLKHIPVVGWGMQFFRFIFLNRSWAADRENLTRSLTRLGTDAAAASASASAAEVSDPSAAPLLGTGTRHARTRRSPLWLLIYPEGTITSDDERAKSRRYAKKQDTDDFKGLLHPRSTGLLFCLRALLPAVPDLQLLDITVCYPGVPFGGYPQEWYGLPSVFWRGASPPTLRVHLHLYSNLASPACEIPGLRSSSLGKDRDAPDSTPGIASEAEAHAFELWLRKVWTKKETQLERMANEHSIPPNAEVIPIRQLTWQNWVAAFGGGGIFTLLAVVGLVACYYCPVHHQQ